MDAKNDTIVNPNDIERRSFEIISKELGHLQLPPGYDVIVKRALGCALAFNIPNASMAMMNEHETFAYIIMQAPFIYL